MLREWKVNMTHFRILVKRYFELIFSDKVSFVMMCLQAPLMLVVVALVCPSDSFAYFWTADTFLFVMVAVSAIMGLLNSYREVCKEREILIRECNSGLDLTAYLLSKIFVLGLIAVLQSAVFAFGSYLIVDVPSQSFFQVAGYWFSLFLVMFTSVCTGIFISCILKSSDSAVLPILFLIIIQVVLSGAIIELEGTVKLISGIVVSRWGMAALGQIFEMNTAFPRGESIKAVYEEPLWESYLIMILLSALLVTVCIFWLKKTLRKRG